MLWNRDTLEDDNDSERWRGPYLDQPVREDRWGNELVYHFPGEIRGESYYDLISVGPDGEIAEEADFGMDTDAAGGAPSTGGP